MVIDVSRRDFFKVSGGAALSGTALGGLAAIGADLTPTLARAQELRIKQAKTTPSVCPYCSVGCGTLVHTVDGKIVNIEGDPRSPQSEGTLCPKGAATYRLHVNPNRPTTVLHRAAGATTWEEWDLDRAMDRVAELVKKTRDQTFIERLPNGKLVKMTPAIFSLGGGGLVNITGVLGLAVSSSLRRIIALPGEALAFMSARSSFSVNAGSPRKTARVSSPGPHFSSWPGPWGKLNRSTPSSTRKA
jgi:formate dehydrogenase major subunit